MTIQALGVLKPNSTLAFGKQNKRSETPQISQNTDTPKVHKKGKLPIILASLLGLHAAGVDARHHHHGGYGYGYDGYYSGPNISACVGDPNFNFCFGTGGTQGYVAPPIAPYYSPNPYPYYAPPVYDCQDVPQYDAWGRVRAFVRQCFQINDNKDKQNLLDPLKPEKSLAQADSGVKGKKKS